MSPDQPSTPQVHSLPICWQELLTQGLPLQAELLLLQKESACTTEATIAKVAIMEESENFIFDSFLSAA